MMAWIPVIAASHVTATTTGTETIQHAPRNPGGDTTASSASCQPIPAMIPAMATTMALIVPGQVWRRVGVASMYGAHQGHAVNGSTSKASAASSSGSSSPARSAS